MTPSAPEGDAATGAEPERRAARWRPALAAVAVGTSLLLAAWALPLQEWLLTLVAWVRGAGAAGVVVFAVTYVAAATLLLPGAALAVGAGMIYGPVWGTALVSPVSVVAATVAFQLGRTVARGWVAERLRGSRRFAAIDEAVGQQGLRLVVLLRLSPVLPYNLLNYALGLTRVRLRHFVLGSFLGMLPATAVYVYLGSLVTSMSARLAGQADPPPALQQALYWVGLLATVAAAALLGRLARRALRRAAAPG